MTIDNAALEVGCDVYYHIRDAVLSVYNVKDLNHSTRMIAQTALQKHFAKHCLSDLQTNKAIIMEDLKVGTVLYICILSSITTIPCLF